MACNLQPGFNINVTFRQIWVQWFSIDFILLQRNIRVLLPLLLMMTFMTINCGFYDMTWTSQHSKTLLSLTPRQNEDLCLSAGWEPSNDWSWSSWGHNHSLLHVRMENWSSCPPLPPPPPPSAPPPPAAPCEQSLLSSPLSSSLAGRLFLEFTSPSHF